MLYKIFEGNIEKFEKKIAAMIKKCSKYNNDFDYTRKEVIFETEIDKLTGIKRTYKYYMVEVDGIIKCDGWEIIGMLEATPNGNLVRTSSDNTIKVPQRYIDNPLICEHCKTNRVRKYAFVLYNENTDEYKSVGKSCLSDFVGKDLEHVAQWYEMQERLTKFAAPITEKRYIYYDNLDVLCYAIAVVKIFGYRKTVAGEESTAYKTLCYMRPSKSDKKEMENYHFEITDDDTKRARDIINYFATCDVTSDYIHNLQVIIRNCYATHKEIGLLVSAVTAYEKHLEYVKKQAELKAIKNQLAKSSYIGNVGEKITANVKEWKCVYSYDTQWGTTHIYQFVTTNNDIIIWKTSCYLFHDETPQNIVISGKVKNHKEYRDTKQTELTRCKITF